MREVGLGDQEKPLEASGFVDLGKNKTYSWLWIVVRE